MAMLVQESRERLYFKLPVFVSDALLHLGVLWFLMKVENPVYLQGVPSEEFLNYCFLLFASFSFAISFIRLRLHERRIVPMRVFSRAFMQSSLTYLIFVVLVAMVHKTLPRHLIVCQFLITVPLISSWHLIVNRLVRLFRKSGHNTRNVLIIGGDVIAKRLNDEFKIGKSLNGYNVMGFFSSLENAPLADELEHLGTVEDFFRWINLETRPDEIYCTLPPALCEDVVKRIIKVCNELFIEFFFVPTMDGYPNRHMRFSYFGKVTIIKLRDEPMNTAVCQWTKRLFDVIVSVLFLFLLFPFISLFVWIGNKLTGSEGPLFFCQERTGYNGKSFVLYKFRSMKVNDDADLVQATEDDPRKTRFGDFLRRTSIDEFPQFINVFRGDMSIIGPRPHMLYHTETYSKMIGDYMVRHLAKPGLTGWAQVNGCRGETRTEDDMRDRVDHDIWYIEHWTMLLDIEIFFKTLWQILPGHDEQAY